MSKIVEYILRLQNNQFMSGIQAADSAANNLNNTMNTLGSAIGVTFGLAGAAMFAKSMVEAGSKVEDARVGLTTLLQYATGARGVINQTMEDATKTPFEFETLLLANKALISAGVNAKQSREDVLNLANAISATGGGNDEMQRMVVNLQQIKNTGEATALDLKQFAYAGINLYKVLESAGIKIDKSNKDQVISYEQITSALKKAHEQGGVFYNGLENMAGNTSVQVSNLGDAMFNLKVKLFEDLKPEITSFIEGLASMIDHLKTAANWLVRHKEFVKETGRALAIAATGFLAYRGAVMAANMAMSIFAATATATPVGAIAAGIGLIALAYGKLASSAEDAKNQINDLRNAQEAKTQSELDSALSQAIAATGKKEEELTQKVAEEAVKRADIRAKELSAQYSALQAARNPMSALVPDFGVSWLQDPADKQLSEVRDEMNKQEAVLGAAQRWLAAKSSANAAAKSGISAAGAAGTKASKPAGISKPVGLKNVTINVHINDMVKTFNVNTTNIKQTAQQTKDFFTGLLMQSINDAQVVAEH